MSNTVSKSHSRLEKGRFLSYSGPKIDILGSKTNLELASKEPAEQEKIIAEAQKIALNFQEILQKKYSGYLWNPQSKRGILRETFDELQSIEEKELFIRT